MVWQYEGRATSFAMGSFRDPGRRLSRHRLGNDADEPLGFTEVDINGNDLLDFYFPDGTQSYRAIKIPTSAFDINLLRATAGKH